MEIFYSPYSISVAMAMCYTGARGNTEAEIAAAMHFIADQGRFHPAFNSLDLLLAERAQVEGAMMRNLFA